MGKDKAPGLDGLSTRFFQKTWKSVGKDVIKVVKDFQDPDFYDRVLKRWETKVKCTKLFQLDKRLRNINNHLKKWNRDTLKNCKPEKEDFKKGAIGNGYTT